MSTAMRLEEVASFPFEGDDVHSVTGLPRGRIATGHGDDTVRVSTTTGDLVATLESCVHALASTPSGDMVFASFDNTVTVWRDNACVHTLSGHAGTVNAVAVSPLDGTIVSGSADNTAKVWSASTGERVATLEGHTESVDAVCVLPNGDVVTGSRDKKVRVWGHGSWACTAVYEEIDEVSCVAVVYGGGLVVGGGTIGDDGFVSLWRGGRREWAVEMANHVHQLAVVDDVIVACCRDSIHIIQDGVCLQEWDADCPHAAALSGGRLAIVGHETCASCKVYRVARPPRLATIYVMITAWSLHGGVPPPAAGSQTATAALARTLSLRRLCRPRVDGDVIEVVEPFARDVVGFM